jgi:phosphoserine phosphatase RsbU/P
MGSSSRLWAVRSTVRLDRQEPCLRVQHVTVFVRDQDRSLRFYLDQLGFSLAADYRFETGGRWVAVAPPDGPTILALVMPKPGSEEYALIGKLKQLTFVTEDVTAKYEEWSRRGVRFLHPPQKPSWGGIFASFEDIDGNSFALVGFDEISQAIEAQRLEIAQKQEAERLTAQEMEIAREVQARLFPQTVLPVETLDYAGICVQAHQVGGDYYDFLKLGEGRLGLVVGDIAGKGIAAALLMASLQANLRSQCARTSGEALDALKSVNQLFYENTIDSAYATLFFADYDVKTRRLRYVNCGHLSGLVIREDGSFERLESTTPVLGLFKNWDGSTGECTLSSGETFVLYTDGITESFNDHGEEFGEQRLIESLRRHRKKASKAMVDSVVEEVKTFSPLEQFDDITLIVAKGQ